MCWSPCRNLRDIGSARRKGTHLSRASRRAAVRTRRGLRAAPHWTRSTVGRVDVVAPSRHDVAFESWAVSLVLQCGPSPGLERWRSQSFTFTVGTHRFDQFSTVTVRMGSTGSALLLGLLAKAVLVVSSVVLSARRFVAEAEIGAARNQESVGR